MAKYKVLVAGNGNTKFNGVYKFSLNVGDIVEGEVSNDGKSINVSFPKLAPGQPNAPIAKFNPKYLQLQAPVVVATAPAPAPNKEEAVTKQAIAATASAVKSQTGVDMGKEGASFLNKAMWYPYVGLGLGYFAALYVGDKKKSTTMGYLGWTSLFATLGIGVGVALMVKSMTGQLDKVAGKLNAASGGGSGSKSDRIKSGIENTLGRASSLASKFISTQLDGVLVKLTDKERDLLLDSVALFGNAIDKLGSSNNVKPEDVMNAFGGLQQQLSSKYTPAEIAALGEKFDFDKVDSSAKATGAKNDKIKSSVGGLISKAVKATLHTIAPKEDLALAKLTDREKDIVLDSLSEMNKAIAKLESKSVLKQEDAMAIAADMQKALSAKYSPAEMEAIATKVQPVFS